MRSLFFVIISALTICGVSSAEELSPRTGKMGKILTEERLPTLRGLNILEYADHPCHVALYGDNQYSPDDEIAKCPPPGPTWRSSGKLYLGSDARVTGLKVCLSKSDRVKGWTIYGKNGSSPNTISDSFKRPNCKHWYDRTNCPQGTHAIGIRAHFEPNTGFKTDDLRGMQLICE